MSDFRLFSLRPEDQRPQAQVYGRPSSPLRHRVEAWYSLVSFFQKINEDAKVMMVILFVDLQSLCKRVAPPLFFFLLCEAVLVGCMPTEKLIE